MPAGGDKPGIWHSLYEATWRTNILVFVTLRTFVKPGRFGAATEWNHRWTQMHTDKDSAVHRLFFVVYCASFSPKYSCEITGTTSLRISFSKRILNNY